ncbi:MULTISPECIES: helix-turn-helix domain-containing protein [Serratia]|uniref:helix-turn-helix domain-containing protein n=1 Tax=Serratia TaxID=613 RepID=UPI001C2BD0D7|nr:MULTISPECIES: helix-turn-helix transcriptional regulator [Serratia]MBV0841527.1 helix-turn-helix transcriptional regulator [Serratia liquefaciens]CAI1138861.1 transcriptional regulator, y4mF family [Serratia proteamaculans]CAI1172831.1 transcriptional regulator, y4mF family [Serratia proteamaculans]
MNNIAEQRNKLGITQSQLASACNMGKSRIANYEIGIRTPGLQDCRVIVSALNNLGAKCLLDEVFPPEKNITAPAA